MPALKVSKSAKMLDQNIDGAVAVLLLLFLALTSGRKEQRLEW